MRSTKLGLCGWLLVAVGCAGQTGDEASSEADLTRATSAYTKLDEHCRTISEAEEGDSSLRECEGMGGYRVLAAYGDGRENIVLRTSNGKYSLDIWAKYPAFGHLGPNAEWRGKFASPGKVDPYALIVRYFTTDENMKEKSYLVVSRITPTASCIIAAVDGTKAGSNEQARVEADKAPAAKCPSEEVGAEVATEIPFDEKECDVVSSHDDGGSWKCGGPGGYTAFTALGDGRQNVTIQTPNGARHDLELWHRLPAFGHLLSWAEFRAIRTAPDKADPHAFVFSYTQFLGDNSEKYYDIVAKVTPTSACIFSVIDTDSDDAYSRVEADVKRARTEACPKKK